MLAQCDISHDEMALSCNTSCHDIVDTDYSENSCIVLASSGVASKEVDDEGDDALVECVDCKVDLLSVNDVCDPLDHEGYSVLENFSCATGQDVLSDDMKDDDLILTRLTTVLNSDNINVRRKR